MVRLVSHPPDVPLVAIGDGMVVDVPIERQTSRNMVVTLFLLLTGMAVFVTDLE
jgi:hypothetical protein